MKLHLNNKKKYLNKSNQIGFKWFDWLESQKWPSIKPLQHTEIDTGYRWFPFLAPLLCTDDSNSRLNWCFGAFSIEAISTFDDKKNMLIIIKWMQKKKHEFNTNLQQHQKNSNRKEKKWNEISQDGSVLLIPALTNHRTRG